MKILCISDHIDPLVYSNNIKERFKEIQLVLSAGDLPLNYYDFIVSSLNKPLLFVFGNHNLKYFDVFNVGSLIHDPSWGANDKLLFGGMTHAGWKVTKVKGLLIAGFGGSRQYNNDENQYSEFEMKMKIARLLPRFLWNRLVHGRYLDIVLTHAPAKGLGDGKDKCHSGFDAFLWLMRRFKPKYLVHGHVHMYDQNSERIRKYHETTVINAYSHVVIEV